LLEMERTEDGDDEKTLIFPQPFPTWDKNILFKIYLLQSFSLVPATPAVRQLPLKLRTGSLNANKGGNFFVFSALRVLETSICRRYRIGLLFILHASAPYTTLRRNYVYTIGDVCLDSTTKSLRPQPYCLLMGRELST
jgi:hypothetical protein